MPEDRLSFIPKKSFSSPIYKTKGPGLLFGLSFLALLISALLFGGMFFYKNMLKKDVSTLNDSLARAKDALEISLINEILGVSDRINSSKEMISQHTTMTPLFDLLQESTLKDVRFKSFNYTNSQKDDYSLSLTGVAKGYTALALQAEVFQNNKFLKNVYFSGLNLDEKGMVNFNVKMSLDPSLLIYKIETNG